MLRAMSMSPSPSLVANLRTELMRFAPFAQMQSEHVERFVAACSQAYYEPGEVVLAPASGVVTQLLFIRRGSISGRQGGDDVGPAYAYEAGDFFPVGAVMGARPVSATYRATADTFCLQLPVAAMHELARDCAPFARRWSRPCAPCTTSASARCWCSTTTGATHWAS
jgi:CBS domain-containing protein